MEKSRNIGGLSNCYGCGVCVVSCPKKIIDLKENRKGFYTPLIFKQEACINCGICLSVCSFADTEQNPVESVQGYAAWSRDANIRHRSSSGGVSYHLAKKAMEMGYKFCGVRYDVDNHRAEHYIAESIPEIEASLGSKYIPSDTSKAFPLFDAKEKYLVVGTPCQIASLRKWIDRRKLTDNFILVDFFCHGVPSLKMWDKYLKENGLKDSKISDIRWRDKQTGWHDSWHVVAVDNNRSEVYRSPGAYADDFYQYFLGHYALNECCLKSCRFKMINSAADIRLGDLWGEAYKNDEKGVSGVLCFTEKGEQLLNSCADELMLIPKSADVVTQGQMKECASTPQGINFVNRAQKLVSLKMALKIRRYYYGGMNRIKRRF